MRSAFEGFLQDFRYGMRGLRRHPGFALTAVIAAALGIGASTAVFSAIDRILFRPLPYHDEDRLMSVGMMAPLDSDEFLLANDYFPLRHNPGPFAAVTSFQAGAAACDLTEHNPIRLRCVRTEANFLETLGVRPAAGRSFNRQEDIRNGPPVAMISYALWSGRFASDPAIAGRTLNLDGTPTLITGVLPKDFVMPTLTGVDVLLPLGLDESRERSGRALRAFGRLKPGITLPQSRAELQRYFQQVLETIPPQFRKEVSLRVRPVRDRQVGGVRMPSMMLFGGVLAVLLIACANIANLLLVRAAGREREMAVRQALGAARWQMARLVLTESLILGVTGGIAGCALAYGLLRAFQTTAPGALPRLDEAAIDLRVLAFAVLASVTSGLLFGLVPALRRNGGPSMGAGRATSPGAGWLRGGLVTVQLAVSLMLLTGAGLLLRSLWNLENVPLGVEREHVMTAKFVLGRQRYATPEAQLAFFTALERKLASIPGAAAAAISDSVPPSGSTRSRPLSTITVEGRPPIASGTGGMVAWRYITPDYFSALGIPLRSGRTFTEEDRSAAAQAVILSASLARQLFGTESATGKRFQMAGHHGWHNVVGVVADVRNAGLEKNASPEFYLVRKAVPDEPFANAEPPAGWRAANVVLRSVADPRLAASLLRNAIAELDPTLPVELETMKGRLGQITERPRFYAALLGVFAATGVALAAIGLFGVMSFLVAQRRREIGVRIALGATPRQVMRLMLAFAGRWMGAGLFLGGAGALLVARWLRSLLFGIDPGDWRALAAAMAMLAAVGLLAAAGPARRASQLDPMETLREE